MVGLSQLKPHRRSPSLHSSQMELISLVGRPAQGSLVRVKSHLPLFSLSLSLSADSDRIVFPACGSPPGLCVCVCVVCETSAGIPLHSIILKHVA